MPLHHTSDSHTHTQKMIPDKMEHPLATKHLALWPMQMEFSEERSLLPLHLCDDSLWTLGGHPWLCPSRDKKKYPDSYIPSW